MKKEFSATNIILPYMAKKPSASGSSAPPCGGKHIHFYLRNYVLACL